MSTNPLYLPQFLAAVPSIKQSTYLVEAHINILSYVHAVIHGPTFRIEHKRWIEALKKGEETEVQWDWLALCESCGAIQVKGISLLTSRFPQTSRSSLFVLVEPFCIAEADTVAFAECSLYRGRQPCSFNRIYYW